MVRFNYISHLYVNNGGGGGGGFFLECEDIGRMFDNSFPACAFFKVEISSRILIPLLGHDRSTVAQRPETIVTECFHTSCV